ncbi:MAG: SAM-dependent DNA methyltransferase [Chlorobiaceae bacterium]|nr:SAM-dependent DNA methyltransferase [Chlorobiaceae bacterium]
MLTGTDEQIITAGELGIDPEELWQTADKLRGSIDAAEYTHVVLGLIFLKYISDAFDARRAKLTEELEADGIDGKDAESLLESRDEYTAENVFRVPPEARWSNILNQGKHPDISKLIDDAMYAIERDNAKLKGKLPRDYARRGIPSERLGALIDQIASIAIGTDEARAKDILGRVYEYFLGKFVSAEGKLDDIRKHAFVLTPGRYVGAAEREDDGEPFEEKMRRLTTELRECFVESDRLEVRIKANLEGLGYDL